MSQLPIKAVLFDLDDTLWPIAPVIGRAEILMHDWLVEHVPEVARRYSIEQLRTHRLDLLAKQPHYQINLSALRHAALCEIFQMHGEDVAKVDGAMAIFLEARHAVTLYDDVRPTLSRLQGEMTLGVVSNGVTDLETIGLAHYFSVALAAHRFGVCKPDVTIFHAACDALNIAPSQAIYVGDDLECDVVGAKNAGMHTIWINRQQRPLPSHIVPDGVLTDLHGLPQWLAQRVGKEQRKQ